MRVFFAIFVFLILGVLFFFFLQNNGGSPHNSEQGSVGNKIKWDFDGNNWSSNSTPPSCPEPLKFPSPIDISLVSGILYPGQIRGTDYKPHGGFRFDNRSDNRIEVRAIMDGYLLKAAKYDDGYDTQIQLFYVNPCGIMVMHDHILTLSPKLEEALRDIPIGQDGDSRTTNINTFVEIKKGDLLATEVGYPDFPGGYNDKNIFVDFGLYDLRRTNGIEYSQEFRNNHPNINEYGTHGICFIDYLTEEDAQIVRGLPAGGSEGKISDYCN